VRAPLTGAGWALRRDGNSLGCLEVTLLPAVGPPRL